MTHTVCTQCKRTWIFNESKICRQCINHDKIIAELKEAAIFDTDFDTVLDTMVSIITNGDRALSDQEIKDITNTYFNKDRTRNRLDEADLLFLQLYRANEMINIGEGVGLTYV